MFLGYFCSSKTAVSGKGKTQVVFFTFTLGNLYLQHGDGNNEHIVLTCSNEVIGTLSIEIHGYFTLLTLPHEQ